MATQFQDDHVSERLPLNDNEQKLLKDGGTATTSSTAAPKSAAKPN